MNRDDIIRMAREAGGSTDDPSDLLLVSNLERFAALVAYAKQNELLNEGWRPCALGQLTTQHCALSVRAALEEREACARVCEHMTLPDGVSGHGDWRRGADDCADAILARGSNG